MPSAVFTPFFRWAFVVGAAAVLFPILILVSTATRLAAARREERLAALRLVGATPPDIRAIAAVEGVVTALAGTVLGTGAFALARPALATAAPIGTEYFASTVTPTVWGYAAMLVAVPVASAVAALLSLRRVQFSPLGVSRRVSPPPPSPWRLTVLAAGVVTYAAGRPGRRHPGRRIAGEVRLTARPPPRGAVLLPTRPLHPQLVRHTFATTVLDAGVDSRDVQIAALRTAYLE